MDTVYIALAEHQIPYAAILGTMVFFVLGWSVFGWSR